MAEYKLTLGRNDSIDIQRADGSPVDDFMLEIICQRLTKLRLSRSAHVYLLRHEFEKIYKIGFTSQPLHKRFSQVSAKEGWISFTCAFPCASLEQARNLETILHDLYKPHHVRGEWFNLPEEEVNRLKEHSSGIQVIAFYLGQWKRIIDFGEDRRFSIFCMCDHEVRQWQRSLEPIAD